MDRLAKGKSLVNIDKAEKERIFALARRRGQLLEAVESSIGISRNAAKTANEKVRLALSQKSPCYSPLARPHTNPVR